MKKKILTLLEAQKKMEHYCAYQERCHKEVVKKLQELGMIPISIDTIVSKLVEDNYLNETRFAQSYARGKFRIKKWGKIRIRRELKARNLSDYNIKKALEEISDLDYNTTFLELFEKRKKEVYENIPSVQKKKIISYMVYRGWELEKIYEAMHQI
ncbi:MAG: regulatory protein RecX [Flavobacteriaceae bacterium]|nr:regulatory protein RecX [Flavobacteriaceae bacterium]|tara:strand:- start:3457 stop:3921 length:465 start_codon:yes stop_codon:yes gene_type:complete